MEAEEPVSATLFSDEPDAGTILPQEKVPGRRRWSRRRIIIFVMVGLLNIGLLSLLASQLLTPASQATNTATNPLLGRPAPDFTLPMLSTHPAPPLHLASLKGKPIMLNFWASWCDPCKQEAPLLENTWQRTQSQGIVFIGIDYSDTRTDGLSFLQQYGITYPNVTDTNGSVAINYGLTGVPETFFIDRHGKIVQKVIGQLTEQTLQNNLQLILRST